MITLIQRKRHHINLYLRFARQAHVSYRPERQNNQLHL